MKAKSEFQRYLSFLRREFEIDMGEHPSLEELLEYHGGRLDEERRERVASHLVQCPGCMEILEDADDFFPARRDQEHAVEPTDQQWEKLWQRVLSAESSEGGSEPAKPLPSIRTVYALAASLLLAFSLAISWALWLQQENRQLAALREPVLNPAVIDLLSEESIERSGGEEAEVVLSGETETFVILLHLDEDRDYADQAVEIRSESGETLWRGEGLRAGPDGTYSLSLKRSFLGLGTFRIVLSGKHDGRWQEVARYRLKLE